MRWALLSLLSGCTAAVLVPPTVDDDPELPALEVEVDGAARRLHLRVLGPDEAPLLLVLHGSASDHRAWLGLGEALSADWRVVLFDQGGAGLSTRLDPDQISFDGVADEILAVRDALAPGEPVAVVAHSFGGMNLGAALGVDPDLTDRVVLLEPGPLTGEVMDVTFQDFFALNLLDGGLNAQQWSWEVRAGGGHDTLDAKYLATLQGTLLQYHCDPKNPPPWPVWRVGAVLERERQRQLRVGGAFEYDFASAYAGVEQITLVGSTCSALGATMQQTWHQPLLPGARLVVLDRVGHRMIVEDEAAVIEAVRDALGAP